MTGGVWAALAAVIAAAVATAIWLRSRSTREGVGRTAPLGGAPPLAVQAPKLRIESGQTATPQLPEKILIGESPENPVLVIENASSIEAYETGRELDVKSGAVGRLASLIQAAPSMLVAAEAHGKRLMEVSIKADLVRASDGNGLRAMAIGKDGIKEHARLFEVDKLQTAIDAAAVWQVASVIVAQKHLADINEKLEEIKNAIKGVSQWLDNQRKPRLNSVYDYLRQGARAIQSGGLSSNLRQEFESCERDLAEIFDHLAAEFEQEVKKKVEHKEVLGTEDLARDLGSKIQRLSELAGDMHMAMKVRAGCLHLVRLYPGETKLVEARKESIELALRRLQELVASMSLQVEAEVSSMSSYANTITSWFGSTSLEDRKSNLRSKRDRVLTDARSGTQRLENGLRRTDTRFLEFDRPTRILVEVREGVLVGAREVVA
jgi:hypothetical protein